MPDELFDLPIGAAARKLGFSVETVRKWAETGQIRAFRTPAPGRRWRFRDSDLIAFMEKHTVEESA